eukprot:10499827-Lingulodinium_polyedra.AAC.1
MYPAGLAEDGKQAVQVARARQIVLWAQLYAPVQHGANARSHRRGPLARPAEKCRCKWRGNRRGAAPELMRVAAARASS